eukprot:10620564-Lingulodinium_polyedra.AAC.1
MAPTAPAAPTANSTSHYTQRLQDSLYSPRPGSDTIANTYSTWLCTMHSNHGKHMAVPQAYGN